MESIVIDFQQNSFLNRKRKEKIRIKIGRGVEFLYSDLKGFEIAGKLGEKIG